MGMQRRKFSGEFKLVAVRLVKDWGVAVAQAARDLDLNRSGKPGAVHSLQTILSLEKQFRSGSFVPLAANEHCFAKMGTSHVPRWRQRMGNELEYGLQTAMIAEVKFGNRWHAVSDDGHRRLAVIMHRMWSDGTEFRWTRESNSPVAA